MIGLGRFFKPPKQNNIRQWRKAEATVRSGFDFTSGIKTPETLAQVSAFSDVMRSIRQTKGEKLARKFNKR